MRLLNFMSSSVRTREVEYTEPMSCTRIIRMGGRANVVKKAVAAPKAEAKLETKAEAPVEAAPVTEALAEATPKKVAKPRKPKTTEKDKE